jgi:LacI family transcriptional regulator
MFYAARTSELLSSCKLTKMNVKKVLTMAKKTRKISGMSIIEIAKLAGVSHTTVSRVMNNEGNVSPETATRIWSIMKEVGYVPKPPSLRRGPRRSRDVNFRTGNVAFLASSESLRVLSRSPVMLDVMHGIEETLALHGMSMVQGAISSSRQLPPIVTRGEVDGIIVWPNLDGVPDETVDALRRYKVVYVMTAVEERLLGDRIKNNNREIGRLAARYLLDRGHRKLGYMTPSALDMQQNMCERWLAFSHAAAAAGAAAHPMVVEQYPLELLDLNVDRERLIEKAVEDLFASEERPTGLFVTCDSLTAKIYPTLKSIGVRPGTDVEIVSCNHEISLLAGLEPHPVSIDIQAELIGKTAVEQLRWRIMHPQDESQVTIEIQPKLLI